MQPGTGTAVATAAPQAPGNAIPEEILSRWSWGPFFLSYLWVFWNADKNFKIIAVCLFVGGFIPFLNFIAAAAGLAFAIYLGLKGNRVMAANRQFASLQDFVAVQTAWAKWGVIVFCVGIVLGVIGGILAVVAAGMMAASGNSTIIH